MVQKAWNGSGIDLIEVVIPPENDDEAEYIIQVHANFFLSNWKCLYGDGCPGMFSIASDVYNDDTGCCGDSFYLNDEEDEARVEAQIENLTPEDWDDNLRKYVEKHGWRHVISRNEDDWKVKGRVFEGGCVFQNRNGGSSGKPGCAFVHMAGRKNLDHIDVMPGVCWQLPLRFNETGDENVWRLGAWDISEWHTEDDQFLDFKYTCAWWCVDSPDAYVNDQTVWKSMEREIRATIGDHAYDVIEPALMERAKRGVAPMPGAVVNDGRPLLPIAVGNRQPNREPSYMPEKIKAVIEQHYSK